MMEKPVESFIELLAKGVAKRWMDLCDERDQQILDLTRIELELMEQLEAAIKAEAQKPKDEQTYPHIHAIFDQLSELHKMQMSVITRSPAEFEADQKARVAGNPKQFKVPECPPPTS